MCSSTSETIRLTTNPVFEFNDTRHLMSTQYLTGSKQELQSQYGEIKATEKHVGFRQTYHSGPTIRLSVHVLVAQTEHECCSVAQTGQHPNTDTKLCCGCMVSCQLPVFVVRNIIAILHLCKLKTFLIITILKVNTLREMVCRCTLEWIVKVYVFLDWHSSCS